MTSQTIAVGGNVPDFTAESTAGPVRLRDLTGGPVVLYFYPKDNTPGCTTETREFGDRHADFTSAGAAVYGISRDTMKSHERFKSALELPFELISDPDESLCNAFGVMQVKNMYGKQVRGVERSTFLVDGGGRLVREWRGVKVPGHVVEVLEAVRALGASQKAA